MNCTILKILLLCFLVSIIMTANIKGEQTESVRTEPEINKNVIKTLLLALPRVSGEIHQVYRNDLVVLMLIIPEDFFKVVVDHENQFRYWLKEIQLYFWYTESDITYEELVKETDIMLQRLNNFNFQDERDRYKNMVIEALEELRIRRKKLDE